MYEERSTDHTLWEWWNEHWSCRKWQRGEALRSSVVKQCPTRRKRPFAMFRARVNMNFPPGTLLRVFHVRRPPHFSSPDPDDRRHETPGARATSKTRCTHHPLPAQPLRTTARRDALLLLLPRSCATLLLAASATPPQPLCRYRTASCRHGCCVYADGVTLLLPRYCYLAALASNTPTKANNQSCIGACKLPPPSPPS